MSFDAVQLLLDYKVRLTTASKSGTKYASSIGKEISILGEVMLPMIGFECSRKYWRSQFVRGVGHLHVRRLDPAD